MFAIRSLVNEEYTNRLQRTMELNIRCRQLQILHGEQSRVSFEFPDFPFFFPDPRLVLAQLLNWYMYFITSHSYIYFS